ERGERGVEVALVVSPPRIGLLEEDAVRLALPQRRPILIGPREAERQPRFSARKDLRERSFEQALPREPVVPIAKCLDAVTLSEVGLCCTRLGQPQIVEPELAREIRLHVTAEQGSRPRDVRPFCEPRTPPRIVLGYRVELREVERDRA